MNDRDQDRAAAEALRRRLAEQARQAPPGDMLAERIIHRAESQGDTTRRRSAPWGRILAVAAAVMAVAGVAAAVAAHDADTDNHEAAKTGTPVTSAPVSPSPSTPTPTSSTSSSSATPSSQTSNSRLITVPTLANVRIYDLTFTGNGNGWALATATCLKGSGTCPALLHTSDSGDSWASRPSTPFTVTDQEPCSSGRCVSHLRFATDDVGYAYGDSALYMTTDGAKHWSKLDGGADAIETLDGNVIRVSSNADGCPPGCSYSVATADIGSPDFAKRTLPGSSPGDGVYLSRVGSQAYLLGIGNPAGGAGRETSTLWTSSDDGASWRDRGEPCAQNGGEVDARALTTAADGTVVVACERRGGTQSQAVARSDDHGAHFTTGPFSLGAAQVRAIGAASSSTILVSMDETFRSTNGGKTFARPSGGVQVGSASYLGFASATTAHAISQDKRTVFTTKDAGRTWQAARLR